MNMKSQSIRNAIATTAGLTLLLTGCAPGSNGVQPAAEGDIVTDPEQMGEVTVEVLDTFTDEASPIGRWMASVVDSFEDAYPNITIDRRSENANDVNSTLRLRISEASAPDIVPSNQGWSGVGDLASSGLLLNLDPYSEAYGWEDSLPVTILQQSMASADGSDIGQGSQYGMPINQGSFVTAFYNREMLDRLGLEVPETFDGMVQALQTAKDAGEIPIAMGTQDGYPATVLLLALQAAIGDGDAIRDFVFAEGGTAADTGLEEAAALYQEWVDAGYFTPQFAGVPSTDALQDFVDGEGLFAFWYSGYLPFPDQAQADRFGQFLLPRQDGGPLTAVGSSSQNFSVAANTEEADAAALFLDFLASPTAGEAAAANQIIPMFGTFEPDSDSPLLNDGIESLNAVTASDGYLPYFDWATPTMLDTLTVELQRMFDGQTKPDGIVDAVQANYDEFRATR
jgi:raffinose/stachyose/melibiose transport system substrate-binding protein